MAMFVGFIWLKRKGLALLACALLGGACSAVPHDCDETRSCPESEPVVSDSEHDGGSGGAAGQPERGHGSAGAAGSTSSAGLGEADAGAPAVAEAPSVLRVSPSDGALGVARDGLIVVTFNHPMDAVATEAAYESSDLPATALDFSWDETGTTLTLHPTRPSRTRKA
jgi:Bacterial Ig-like domain